MQSQISPDDAERCNCEHQEHFTGSPSPHEYRKVPAGHQRAVFVGRICDACASGHYAGVLASQDRE